MVHGIDAGERLTIHTDDPAPIWLDDASAKAGRGGPYEPRPPYAPGGDDYLERIASALERIAFIMEGRDNAG